MKLETVRIGQKHTITREQQDQLLRAHAEKVKRISRDRNLFFIWVCYHFYVLKILCSNINRSPFLWSLSSQCFTIAFPRHGVEPRASSPPCEILLPPTDNPESSRWRSNTFLLDIQKKLFLLVLFKSMVRSCGFASIVEEKDYSTNNAARCSE